MTTNDKDIISAMREDAERGFRLLMQSYKEPLYWHIRRLVVNHDDAQDAAQETFIRIYRSFGQYNEQNSLRAWLFRIATNEALRLIRRRHEDTMPIDGSFDAHADCYVNYGDLESVRLQKAIHTLPPKQQLAFNLRYFDEMDYDEIAQIAETTPASVKASYHVAKEKIIKYVLAAAAAVVALFFAIQPLLPKNDAEDFESVELAFNNLSADDQDFLIQVYEDDDLFINP